MISQQTNPLWGNAGARVLAIVLLLGAMAMHAPRPAPLAAARSDSSDSCGSCQCTPDGPLARPPSSGGPDAASHVEHPERDAQNDEPCCANGCGECALPCCGGVTFAMGPSETSLDPPPSMSIVPVAVDIPPDAETAGVFHPPRI